MDKIDEIMRQPPITCNSGSKIDRSLYRPPARHNNHRNYMGLAEPAESLTSKTDPFLHLDTKLHTLCMAEGRIQEESLRDLLVKNPEHAVALDTNYSRTPLHYLVTSKHLTVQLLNIYMQSKFGKLATEAPDECGERTPLDYLLENQGYLLTSNWVACVEAYQKQVPSRSQPLLTGYLIDTTHRKDRLSKLSMPQDDYDYVRPGKIRNGPNAWSRTVRVKCEEMNAVSRPLVHPSTSPFDTSLRVLDDRREKAIDVSKQHDSSVAPKMRQ